jgi:hypothetical protein
MPDRIVRVGILTSDPVNLLSWAAEVFYRRLFNVVDDYGRYDARPAILRSHLYPLKVDRVSDSDVGKWLTECVNAGLVSAYQVSGRPYLEVLKFGQRVRADKSKWPQPPSSADICQQPLSDAPVFVPVVVVVDDKPAAQAFIVPEWIPGETWAAYLKTRTKKKAGNEPHALGLIVKDLEAFRAMGHDAVTVLNNSIKGGWAGVFEPKTAPGEIRRMTVPGSDKPDAALAKIAADAAKAVAPSAETRAKLAALRQGAH